VAGGTGQVGFPIVAACLAAGARVYVPSRSAERLAKLEARLTETVRSRFIPLEGHIGTPEGAAQMRDDILKQVGQLDGVVASLGGWWSGKQLLEVSMEQWQQILSDNLTSHFVVAKTFLPVLKETGKGAYLVISNPAAELPRPYAGPVSVALAGAKMLTRVFQEELAGGNVRVRELVYAPSRQEDHWLTLDAMLREIIRQVGR
jgi:3-oxoacyl-[acyl-carrier protein] reductase